MLVEKIASKIRLWATKTTSYAGRVALVNSALLGILNFWATIFLIPKGVLKEIEALCKNYLWGSDQTYKKVPYVAWEDLCKPKKYRGLGLKNM